MRRRFRGKGSLILTSVITSSKSAPENTNSHVLIKGGNQVTKAVNKNSIRCHTRLVTLSVLRGGRSYRRRFQLGHGSIRGVNVVYNNSIAMFFRCLSRGSPVVVRLTMATRALCGRQGSF